MPLIGQAHSKVTPDHHQPLMRPISFIGGKQVDIGTQLGNIHKAMRRIAHPINTRISTSGADQCRDFRHGVHRSNHIGTMRKTHHPHRPIKQSLQILRIQQAGLWINAPFFDLNPTFGQAAPGARIGLMVLIGHDDGLPRFQPLPDRLRQNIGILGGGGSKTQLITLHTQHSGQARTRLVHFRPAQARCLIRRIRLYFALPIEPGQTVLNLHTGVRATSIFKKRLPLQRGHVKGREILADKL